MLVHHLPVCLENTTELATYPVKIFKKNITNTQHVRLIQWETPIQTPKLKIYRYPNLQRWGGLHLSVSQ